MFVCGDFPGKSEEEERMIYLVNFLADFGAIVYFAKMGESLLLLSVALCEHEE